MLYALIFALGSFAFLVLARALGIGRLVRPGIGGLGGWRQERWPQGVQEEYPERPWGSAQEVEPPAS